MQVARLHQINSLKQPDINSFNRQQSQFTELAQEQFTDVEGGKILQKSV